MCAAGVALARVRRRPSSSAARWGRSASGSSRTGGCRPRRRFDAYREQAAALADAGADLLVMETQTDVRELEQAVAAVARGGARLAVVASATFTRDDRTLLGDTPESVAQPLAELGVDAIGVNCGEGPAQAVRIVAAMAPVAASAGPAGGAAERRRSDPGRRPVRLSGDTRLRR